MTMRVAVIGAGRMGRRHLQHWARIPEVEVVGVLDLHAAAAAELGPAYNDWATLLAQARPDIIDLCTPTEAHRDGIEKATAAGKAVFVEKPLARTLADCDAIVAAVERAGTPFMAGHVVRFFPAYAAAKRIVDGGGVGVPAAVRTARLSGFPTSTGQGENWYADPALSGGVILDLLLHDLDWLRWTFGPVTRIMAVGPEQYALVTLRFASGVVGHVTGSWAHSGFRTTLEVAGDAGLIEHDSARSATLVTPSGLESPLAVDDDPYYMELSAFVRALQDGAPSPVTVYDAYEAARLALAALQSQETGKMVTLS